MIRLLLTNFVAYLIAYNIVIVIIRRVRNLYVYMYNIIAITQYTTGLCVYRMTAIQFTAGV